MKVAVASDHAGYPLKETIIAVIEKNGHEVLDLGAFNTDSVDYPDYAEKAGRAIQEKRAERAVVLCGSGVGASIAANKMNGIYAGLCHDTYSAHQGVEHDNMNVICIGARIIGPELACEIVSAFLGAAFTGEERHMRRVGKIHALEQKG